MKKLSYLRRMSATILIAGFGLTANAYPYGDNVQRSQCIVALAQAKYFQDHPLTVDDRIPGPFHHEYQLNPNAIVITNGLGKPLWKVDKFLKDGDVYGAIALQTTHAQILFIAKALSDLRTAQLNPADTKEILGVLDVCARVQAKVPAHPETDGLYGRDQISVPEVASDLARILAGQQSGTIDGSQPSGATGP